MTTVQHESCSSVPSCVETAQQLQQHRHNNGDADSAAAVVSFGEIRIREYSRDVGTSPARHGPPLGLGWRYNQREAISVDAYERTRIRRSKRELRLSPKKREYLLASGFRIPAERIRKAERESQKALEERAETAAQARAEASKLQHLLAETTTVPSQTKSFHRAVQKTISRTFRRERLVHRVLL